MMLSGENYRDEWKEKTYLECIKERDKLIRSIRKFEKYGTPKDMPFHHPMPGVIYQMELQYLSEISKLIAEKYSDIQYVDED